MKKYVVRAPQTDRFLIPVPERSADFNQQPVLSVARTSAFDTRFDPSDYSPGVVRTFLTGTLDRSYVFDGSFAAGVYTVQQAGLYFINLRLVFASTVTGSWVMLISVGYSNVAAPAGWPPSLADGFIDGRTGTFQIPYSLTGLLRLPAGAQVTASIVPTAVSGTGGVFIQTTAQLDIFQVGP